MHLETETFIEALTATLKTMITLMSGVMLGDRIN